MDASRAGKARAYKPTHCRQSSRVNLSSTSTATTSHSTRATRCISTQGPLTAIAVKAGHLARPSSSSYRMLEVA